MDAFSQALSMSLMSLIMAFAVLILIMLAMYALAAFVGKREQEGSVARQQAGLPRADSAPSVVSDAGTEPSHVAAIMAALNAAQVDIPSGGRIRIEKVSRRG